MPIQQLRELWLRKSDDLSSLGLRQVARLDHLGDLHDEPRFREFELRILESKICERIVGSFGHNRIFRRRATNKAYPGVPGTTRYRTDGFPLILTIHALPRVGDRFSFEAQSGNALRDAAGQYAGTVLLVGATLEQATSELETSYERLTREHRRKA